MILQKLKSRAGHRSSQTILAEEVEELRLYDWTDPLFDEWCSSATKQLTSNSDGEAVQKDAYCQLVSKVCA
jgi:hypothetical protein